MTIGSVNDGWIERSEVNLCSCLAIMPHSLAYHRNGNMH